MKVLFLSAQPNPASSHLDWLVGKFSRKQPSYYKGLFSGLKKDISVLPAAHWVPQASMAIPPIPCTPGYQMPSEGWAQDKTQLSCIGLTHKIIFRTTSTHSTYFPLAFSEGALGLSCN